MIGCPLEAIENGTCHMTLPMHIHVQHKTNAHAGGPVVPSVMMQEAV